MIGDKQVSTFVEESVAAKASRSTILIVEDTPCLQSALSGVFTDEQYRVIAAKDSWAVLKMFREERPLAVLIDLISPNSSRHELCRVFKDIAGSTAVVVLCAIAEESEKVHLLELGVDDYLTKPFSPRELAARLEMAIRKQQKPALANVYSSGDWEIDFPRMIARRNGIPVVLTAHEFKLLRFLIENAELVFSRDELLNRVGRHSKRPTSRAVDNQILKLRQKLESDPANPLHFLTIRGAGYKFVP
jgi:DNA-binding response OmpR family regulator